MSSHSRYDINDYSNGNSEFEDRTLFFPEPGDGFTDGWSGFLGGVLLGLTGSALLFVAPWLAGVFIVLGYGMTGYTLSATRNGFVRALAAGFGIAALLGGLLVVGDAFWPKSTWSFLLMSASRTRVFVWIAVMPWFVALLLYAIRRLRA